MVRDYYGILGVGHDAGPDEIKRAYRRLARELHPDVNPDAAAQERFAEVSAAYDVLSDPEKRRIVDLGGDPLAKTRFRSGEQDRSAGFGPPPGTPPADLKYFPATKVPVTAELMTPVTLADIVADVATMASAFQTTHPAEVNQVLRDCVSFLDFGAKVSSYQALDVDRPDAYAEAPYYVVDLAIKWRIAADAMEQGQFPYFTTTKNVAEEIGQQLSVALHDVDLEVLGHLINKGFPEAQQAWAAKVQEYRARELALYDQYGLGFIPQQADALLGNAIWAAKLRNPSSETELRGMLDRGAAPTEPLNLWEPLFGMGYLQSGVGDPVRLILGEIRSRYDFGPTLPQQFSSPTFGRRNLDTHLSAQRHSIEAASLALQTTNYPTRTEYMVATIANNLGVRAESLTGAVAAPVVRAAARLAMYLQMRGFDDMFELSRVAHGYRRAREVTGVRSLRRASLERSAATAGARYQPLHGIVGPVASEAGISEEAATEAVVLLTCAGVPQFRSIQDSDRVLQQAAAVATEIAALVPAPPRPVEAGSFTPLW